MKSINSVTTILTINAFLASSLLILSGSLMPSSHASNSVDWILASGCPQTNSPQEIQCGDIGNFYLNSPLPGGCNIVDQGTDTPSRYFRGVNFDTFPDQPVPIDSLPSDQTESDRAYLIGPVQELDEPQLENIAPEKVWIGIVDFTGDHGNSVQWLIEEVAGKIPSKIFALDEPGQAQDSVSDVEVLTQLCALSREHERRSRFMMNQVIVNMSFGRALREDDPKPEEACDQSLFSCQILHIIENLSDRGATLVAAAGKQRGKMFPGILQPVIAAGTLNPALFTQQQMTRPLWEMPDQSEALMPGSSLCLRGGWPAPAGASYASAVTSGWLARAILLDPTLTLDEPGQWKPLYSETHECVVLSKNNNTYSGCNPMVTHIFEGLDGGFVENCWLRDSGVSIQAEVFATALPQPTTVSALNWDPSVRPSPEGDPCVPCTGGQTIQLQAQRGFTSDYSINFSGGGGYPADIAVESVHLRADNLFYAIDLNKDQLELIRNGQVNSLELSGAVDLLNAAASASLYFTLRDVRETDCETSLNSCAWVSSHIHSPPDTSVTQ